MSQNDPPETSAAITPIGTPRPGPADHLAPYRFKPGNTAAAGHSHKLDQMAIFRHKLEDIDPQTERPRLLELFNEIYLVATGRSRYTASDGESKPRLITGRDMVAAAQFLVEQTYGAMPKELENPNGIVRVVQINIPPLPAGSKLAIGMQVGDEQAIQPEFEPE